MTIRTASKHLFKLLTAVGLIAALAACGGGGGDNKDSTPDAFSFPAIPNVEVSTEVSSAAVSVTGINQTVAISITGGTYSVGGGAFTSAAGTVSNGQSVTVKVTSSATTNTAAEAVLTIGGVTGNFKVTTKLDVTPDNFSFSPATEVVPNAVSTSAPITVAGIDTAVPIIISGTATKAEYSINDAPYTAAPGTVSKNQTVKVRGTAAATTTTSSNVVLTIGGVSGTYKITTLADTVAPTAQILFPPPVSMTEGNTILVRGTASDDYSAVTIVKVNGIDVTPKAAGDFSTWQVAVPLTALADNNVIVTTEDSAGNKSSTQLQPAAQVTVRQGDYKNAFPDNNVTFKIPRGLVIDKLDGRNRLVVSDHSGDDGARIVSIDLITGKRSIFASVNSDVLVIEPSNKRLYGIESDELIYLDLADATKHEATSFTGTGYGYISSLTVDDSSSIPKIVGVERSSNLLLAHEVSSANFSVVSDAAILLPNADNPFLNAYALVFDKKNSRYLVANGGQKKDISKHAVIAVDRITGARTVLSSNTVGGGDLFTALLPDQNVNALSAITVDEKNNRAIVSELLTGTFFFIDLTTGDRRLFSDSSQVGAINPLGFVTAIALEESGNYIFALDEDKHGVYAIDLVTGQRVIFSKSVSDL